LPPVTGPRLGTNWATRWFLLIAGLAVSPACVRGESQESLESTANTCVTDSDCTPGICVQSLCSAEETRFGALLLEVVPPPANTGFLGARYYKSIDLGALNKPEQTDLSVAVPLTMSGEIYISLGDPACRPSPVEVTFVPIETYLGLDTVRYSTVSRVGTTIIDKKHVDTHTYQLPGIPPGRYDVFLRDAELVDNTATPSCEVVPDVQRGIDIAAGTGTTRLVYNIVERPARSLRVVVPSRRWQGWRVDVVHAKSKELQSSRSVLVAAVEPTLEEAYADIRLSTSEPDTNQLLLRLRPPDDRIAPSVSMVLAGLEVFEVGQALVPRIEPFEQLVTYETWVWRTVSGGGPVPGKVHFTALELANVPAGVTATFDVWSDIGGQGLVSETLPPGKYRVDVKPQPDSGFSSASSLITVWAAEADLPSSVQGGHVLQVNEAVKLRGTLDALGQRPPIGTQVRLVGIDAWPRTTGVGIDSPVRGSSLPANVSDLISVRAFQLDDVDCGNCRVDAPPILYNLEVVPTERSGFPRLLIPGVAIHGERPLAELQLDLPRVLDGNVVVKEGTAADPTERAFPGVLVRAYALLSPTGQPFDFTVPRCWEQPSATACAASALEIASTYTGIDGSFRLLLPQGFTHLSASEATDAGM
jgi:hypothetical protein